MIQANRHTRDATQVYFHPPDDLQPVPIGQLSYTLLKSLPCKPFKTQSKPPQVTMDMLQAKLHELIKLKDERRLQNRPAKHPDLLAAEKDEWLKKMSWQDAVNRKRQLLADYLSRQPELNYAEAARYVGCTYAMAKRVHQDLLWQGQAQQYTYPNAKQPDAVRQLDESLSQVDGSYATLCDLKRQHPGFSRKWIARRLRRTHRLRYLIMQRQRKVPKKNKYKKKQVRAVVCHLAQALANPQVTTLYVDEVHFPLYQTATHHWRLPDTQLQPGDHRLVYNRRPYADDVTKLSVIALCSLEGFHAVQVFTQPITAEDYLYFLQETLSSYRGLVSLLTDNPTCHNAHKVMSSAAGKCQFFNAPGLFRANAIENAFSFVRSEWRKRRIVESLEEEVRMLVGIFFAAENERRWRGVARNHLRSLIGLHEASHLGAEEEEL